MRYVLAIMTLCGACHAPAAERAIHKEAIVAAPVEAAFAAWSTGEGLESFLAPEAAVDAKPGGPFFVHFNPFAPPGLRGADDMRVLAVQPNRMISFTWNTPPSIPEARGQRTFVVVRVEPVEEGKSRVSLTHTGWGDGGAWDAAYDYFDKAWGRVLSSLETRFARGPVDWSASLDRLKAASAELPKYAERTLRHEAVVDADRAAVWRAFSDPREVARWAAPHVVLDFRTGGLMRSSYDRNRKVGAAGTIHLDILNVIEDELVTYKVHLTDFFPAKARMEDGRLQQIVQLLPGPEGRTRIVATMVGFGTGPEWDKVYEHFAKGNDYTMGKLAALFPKK